jgi:hypothetical protein
MYVSVGGVTTTQSSHEFFLAANAAALKLYSSFTLNRLYVPLNLAEFVETFASELLRKVQNFQLLVGIDDGNGTTTESAKISGYVKQEVPKLLIDLELEFRRRLGQKVS